MLSKIAELRKLHLITKQSTSWVAGICAVGAVLSSMAVYASTAHEKAPEKAAPGKSASSSHAEDQSALAAPCATLVRWNGSLQVLDQKRTSLIDLDEGVAVPCGAWITSQKGWAVFRHRLGHMIAVSAPTLFEIQPTGDVVSLYRGQVLIQSAEGAPSPSVVTANGRARVEHGSAMVTYQADTEDTQLVSLERESTLENRYEPDARTVVKAGEGTVLNLNALRIVPSRARAVAAASLKAVMDKLPLDDQYKSKVIRLASLRTNPNEVKEKNHAEPEKQGERKLASVPEKHEAVEPAIDPKEKAKVIEELSKIKPEN